jgi:hypothetical protein
VTGINDVGLLWEHDRDGALLGQGGVAR